MRVVLEVRDLTIGFDHVPVITDLSFTVADGECLAIIGPNGSGKTVLLRALIAALPYRGTIRWAAGAKVGYVPQTLDIERDLPLTGNDFLRAKAHVGRSSADDIRRALDLVSLGPEIAAKPIGTLSGGQFQRLLLAFAFLGRPSVLLFDEPTAGIDAPGEERIYETIQTLQRREHLTLVLISHELSVVYRYATTVLCLGRGRPYLGPPAEVLTPQRLAELYGGPIKFHAHE